MPDQAGATGPDPLDAARQAELLELTQDAILVRDALTSAVMYWNRGAEQLYGWSRDEARGQITHQLLRTRFPMSVEAADAALVSDGYWEGELTHQRRDGSSVVVASRQAIQCDASGAPVAILEINTDITLRKQAEEEHLRRLTEQRGRELAERALDQLSRLQAVRTALSEALTPAQVAAVVMDHGISALSAIGGAIVRVDAAQATVEILAIRGYDDATAEHFGQFRLDEPLPVNDVLRCGEPLFLPTFDDVRRAYPDRPDVGIEGALAVAPFIVNGVVTGALTLSFDGPVTFEPDERQLVIALSIQCAHALERTRLFELAVRTQEDLRRSRDQLEAILAGIAEGVTVQDARGALVYANDVAARMTGFDSAAAFLAAPGAEVISRFALSDERGQPLGFDRLPGRRVLRGERPREVVVQYRDYASGEQRWSILDAAPVLDAEGRVQLVVNIFRDITERKRQTDAAAFLAAASSVLSSTLDAQTGLDRLAELAVAGLADWCLIDLVDPHVGVRRVVVTHADPARESEARAFRRQDARDILAGTIGQVLRNVRSERVEDMSPAVRAELARESPRMRLVDAIDARSWISAPMQVRGTPVGVITLAMTGAGRNFSLADQLVVEDVAGRAALALENARLYSEAQEQAEHQSLLNGALRSTIDERDHALVDLRQAQRTRDEFLASASHDLKNPLASIKATAQLLRRRIDQSSFDVGRIRDGLTRLDEIATRAAGQVDELLDLARMQMGQPLELDRQPVDLVALVRQALDEQQLATDRHTLTLESDETELIGSWDPRRLARVLTNLLDNALKYSPTGGGVVVRVRREPPLAVLEVQDSGIGIPASDIGRIFERFQRASNVEGRVGGTGIGLASARHFVESHGGTIDVDSKEHVGTVFRVSLPLLSEETN